MYDARKKYKYNTSGIRISVHVKFELCHFHAITREGKKKYIKKRRKKDETKTETKLENETDEQRE